MDIQIGLQVMQGIADIYVNTYHQEENIVERLPS